MSDTKILPWSGRKDGASPGDPAFSFAAYEFDDDGFGTIETGEVVVVLDPQTLAGIRMSKEDALRFGAAIIETAVGRTE